MARIIDAFTQFFDNSGNPLAFGKLQFLESGTNNTDKTTFKDAAMTAGLENTNPVELDGAGRLAFSVFGSGVYNVILFNSGDGQIQQFDPVGASLTSGQFVSWSPSETYDEGDIRRGSDGEYYQSVDNNNSNNNPISSPDDWDLVTIVKSYIANATGTGDVITADFTPNIHALANNIRVTVTASAANSSTVPTFAPNGLTAKIIVKSGNQPLIAGDIAGSGFQADMIYRSGIDKWELLNPSLTNYMSKAAASTAGNIVKFASNGGADDSGISISRVVQVATAGGTADVITATFTPALTLAAKLEIRVTALFANATATPTFNGRTIVKQGDQALIAGDISGPGHEMQLVVNAANTKWELLNPVFNKPIQVWTDVTGSRSLGVTFTNTSGRSISVSATVVNNSANNISAVITMGNGVQVIGSETASGAVNPSVYAEIPNGETYTVTSTGASSILNWAELI